ncbi:DUF433 domain-containing protein (plasmid) [Synechococcus elongatus PCC 11801]|uniref:DUF433 domain-containing protein n=1 Tax=Synechococcus elongatus PCC 11801 TaxID=2219813 RepID=A0ACD5A689_SYNEL
MSPEKTRKKQIQPVVYRPSILTKQAIPKVLVNKKETLKRLLIAGTERRREVCSGQLVFKGTRTPVEWIAGQMRQGASVKEIKEYYPHLSNEAVRIAHLYSQLVSPREGKVKPLILKRI